MNSKKFTQLKQVRNIYIKNIKKQSSTIKDIRFKIKEMYKVVLNEDFEAPEDLKNKIELLFNQLSIEQRIEHKFRKNLFKINNQMRKIKKDFILSKIK